jgi:hypothetical protein
VTGGEVLLDLDGRRHMVHVGCSAVFLGGILVHIGTRIAGPQRGLFMGRRRPAVRSLGVPVLRCRRPVCGFGPFQGLFGPLLRPFHHFRVHRHTVGKLAVPLPQLLAAPLRGFHPHRG